MGLRKTCFLIIYTNFYGRVQSEHPVPLSNCPLCQDTDLRPWFLFHTSNVTRCGTCGFVMLDPQPDDAILAKIYGETYFIGNGAAETRNMNDWLKRGTAKLQLAEIEAALYPAQQNNSALTLLEIGCGLGNFLHEAHQQGYKVRGIDVSESAVARANTTLGAPLVQVGHLETADFTLESFDVVVMADVIEHVRDPKAFIGLVKDLVKPDGLIFVAVPSLDSLSAKLMGRHWMEFKLEHLYYFDKATLTRLLSEAGFIDIRIRPGRKLLNLYYIIEHFNKFPVTILSLLLRLVGLVIPSVLQKKPFKIVASGINATARKPR